MPTTKGSESGLSAVIWQDIKVFLASALLFGFTPLGLILMWSWGIYTPRVRKVFTWIGTVAILVFLLHMADKHKKGMDGCGFGRGHRWGMGCGSGSCGDMRKGCPMKDDEAQEDEDESVEKAPAVPAPQK